MSEMIFVVKEAREGEVYRLGCRRIDLHAGRHGCAPCVSPRAVAHHFDDGETPIHPLAFRAGRRDGGMKLPRDQCGVEQARALGWIRYRVTRRPAILFPAGARGAR